MIHSSESNNNPSSKELANCHGFNFNTRVWIYNHFSRLFQPPMKHLGACRGAFYLGFVGVTLFQSAVLLKEMYYMQRLTRCEYFKLTVTEKGWISNQQEAPLIDHGQTGGHLSFTCTTVAFIQYTKQLMFLCVHNSFCTLHANKTCLITEKNYIELLHLVTHTKLFCFKQRMGLYITCWGYKGMQNNTCTSTHLLLIFSSIVMRSVHIIVIKLLQGNKDSW